MTRTIVTAGLVAHFASGCCLDSVGGATYGLTQRRGPFWESSTVPWGDAMEVDPSDGIEVGADRTPPEDVLVLFDAAGDAVAFEPLVGHVPREDGSCPHETATFTFDVPEADYTLVHFVTGDEDFEPNNCVPSDCNVGTYDGRIALVVEVTVLIGAPIRDP